jgi:hypothetical protein
VGFACHVRDIDTLGSRLEASNADLRCGKLRTAQGLRATTGLAGGFRQIIRTDTAVSLTL